MKPLHSRLFALFIALNALASISLGRAQTTAFTYQGQLSSGTNPANGAFDLKFSVYDANVAGNFIAGPVTNSAVAVSGGLFTVTLDFGAGVFTGTNYWVEMSVRTNGLGTFATLVPRQQLTPAPAAFSLSVQSPQFNSFCPPGSVLAFAGAAAPAGWLLCNGTTVSRAQYPALFAVLGTTYGSGDGSTTFNLPDMRGRTIAGKDNMGGTAAGRLTSGGSGITATSLGASGGAESTTLTAAQSGMPNHTHGSSTLFAKWWALTSAQNPFVQVSTPPWTANVYGNGGGRAVSSTTSSAGVGIGGSSDGPSISGGGSDATQPHNITQPTIVLNYIIKY